MMFQPGKVGRHQLEYGLQTIGHIHHRQPGLWPQEAGVSAVDDGLIKNGYGIVGGPAAGQSLVAYDAREAAAPTSRLYFLT